MPTPKRVGKVYDAVSNGGMSEKFAVQLKRPRETYPTTSISTHHHLNASNLLG